MSTSTQCVSLIEHFGTVSDPRINRTRRHNLIDILVIGVCAVISGADDFVHMALFGEAKLEWFKARLDLPNGIPSHDTFARVFALLDPQGLEKAFLGWVQAVQSLASNDQANPDSGACKEEIVSLDGKTVRRSHDAVRSKSAIHMVSAWATKARLVLGQVKVDDKSNEITAIPDLLDLLDVTGCLITIDAMGCQVEIAEKIVEHKADFMLALKGNQPTLEADVEDYFRTAPADELVKKITVEKGHGRIETRIYTASKTVEWITGSKSYPGQPKFKNINTIVKVVNQTEYPDRCTFDTRLYISSAALNIERIAAGIRGHWGVESMHWLLDVAFGDDLSRYRTGHGAKNMAVVRRFALGLVRANKTKKSVKTKRKSAGWNTNFLLELLQIK